MFNSAILDTLIGLMLMYAALALVASGITELVSGMLKTRAKNLEKAISQFLGSELFGQFCAHPRIALLTTKPDSMNAGLQLPSYLTQSTFSATLFVTLKTQLASAMMDVKDGATEFDRFKSAIQERARASGKSGPQARLWTLLAEAAEKAEKTGIHAEEQIAAFHVELENFYNELADRMSGWFKRSTHTMTVLVALLVCGFINADTLQVARTLSTSAEMRANLVRASLNAEGFTKESTGIGCAVTTEPAGEKNTGNEPGASASQTLACQAAAIEARVSQAGTAFPIGWVDFKVFHAGGLAIAMKFLGILISALAVSLGAGFWFNALQNIMRLTGKIPDKAATDSGLNAGSSVKVAGNEPTPPPGNAVATVSGSAGWGAAASVPADPKLVAQLLKASRCAYLIDGSNAIDWGNFDYYNQIGFVATPVTLSGGNAQIDACLIGSTQDAIILAFRGTEPINTQDGPDKLEQSILDWVNDADAILVPAGPGIEGGVHKGFNDSLSALWDGIARELKALQVANPQRKLYITGHSKGGAVAYIAAMRAKQCGIGVNGVITFAAARPGDGVFAAACEQGFGNLWRYEFQNDLVPHLPPSGRLVSVLARIWPALSGMKSIDFESVGALQFINWDDAVVADSPGLDVERFVRLGACLMQGKEGLKEIGDAHSLSGGYARVLCR